MTAEFQGRLFPKEAAEQIGIAPATLRKYSQIIEEVLDDANFFDRTEQNNRTYSAQNIELLKTISKDSSETKKPVKSIVENLKEENPKLFTEDEDKKEVEETTKSNNDGENETTPALNTSVQEFLNIINQQNQKIDQLMQMVSNLSTDMQDMKPMVEQSQHLLEVQAEEKEEVAQDQPEEKIGFFKRLFGGK